MGWFSQNSTLAGLTWVGTILTLIGIIFTFFQAAGAKKSAKAAEDAANSALNMLQGSINVANVAYAYSQLELLKDLVNTENYSASRIIFNPLRRSIVEICHLLKGNPGLQGQISVTYRNLSKIQTQLDKSASIDVNKTVIIRALSGFVSICSFAGTRIEIWGSS
jgi:hypothetical protein